LNTNVSGSSIISSLAGPPDAVGGTPRPRKYQVAIIDDDSELLQFLKQTFESHTEFKCVGCFTNAQSALDVIPRTSAQVVLVDIVLPDGSGIECTHKLKGMRPDLQCVMMTGMQDRQLLVESLMAGATGYIVKPVSGNDVRNAVVEVINGGAPLSRIVSRMLVQTFRGRADGGDLRGKLSVRERGVMAGIFQDLSDKEIAVNMGIGVGTVHTHMHNLFTKLGVHNRREAVERYRDMTKGG